MAKRAEKPFNKIMAVRAKLSLYTRYGINALGEQTVDEFISDVAECFEYLIEFRNIINGMVAFNEPPSQAVIPYLSEDILATLDAR